MKDKIKDRIIPSAPFKNFAEIENLARKTKGKLHRMQIDICDGKCVASKSWPFTDMSEDEFLEIGKNIGTVKEKEVTLPAWENIDYSADIMCEEPEKYIESLVAYGIDEVVVHFRTLGQQPQENFENIVSKCKRYELNLVLALDVKTDMKAFLNFAKKNVGENVDGVEGINAFQVMGIENIGFQGQELDLQSLELVKILKENFKEIPVYFDGAINEATILKIKESGVDKFCVGSYLTKAADFTENLQIIKKLL